jgi:hypothetical protein
MIEALGIFIYFTIAVFCSVLVAYPILWICQAIAKLNKLIWREDE